ncbi:AraC family transcriptional regulator of adaptative response/methylated-DNA-[protein]-cysteine methyltransferase [Wenyingzhuangia heitensis]|uniref:AraC family transcriptional regulator of adaptative response/methylated-DNA-[protein]-cysteine methyltransferase n=1 Tax=Wenyingzhuangia heitensis TaxID=1487859 RepID=A0ABX0U9V1_9FLAO|nr:methylated-DNA--[protein]-cysteine S-methyltransferase [Wenyingzhuangia heitensis]NIJ44575.1 AraC family transcriptional regulator of adaptative response/methylated-DNA-[protein]-cysteine methyltransferase [Wenyingzhuangia heitensis]
MEQTHYHSIAKAITYLQKNATTQPSLDELAKAVNISPFHLQKIFTEWAGVSPKKFLQYISIQHAKQLLLAPKQTLFTTAHQIGLSSTSRLHDLFVNIEGMTPGEYKNNGQNLTIYYKHYPTLFGTILIANTVKGICSISFIDEPKDAIKKLKTTFSNASYLDKEHPLQIKALQVFNTLEKQNSPLLLHLKGTPFQLKVWEALLTIPVGKLETYGNIAHQINSPKASRAVGTAIGNNPIAFLIPCHRVIRASGIIGNYMWGTIRKSAIIGWESSKTHLD